MLSAKVLELASMTAPALAQTLKDSKCTGRPDIPWDEQIVGCTNAIKSGRYTGKNLAAAFNGRGTAYRAKRDLVRAIQDYDQAIKLNPNDVRAISNRGNAYLAQRQYDRAIEDYDLAIALDPKEAIPFNNRGNAYYKKGQVDRAIQDFDLAIELDP